MKINRLLSLLYIGLAGGLMMTALFQCQSEKEEETQASNNPADHFKNLHDSVEYVGRKTCRQCHADVYQSFKQTGMGQSYGAAKPSVSDADFSGHPTVYDSFKNFYYTPFWRDSNLFIKEYRLKNGDTTHKRVQKIDHIIGSGQHTNSHIYSVNGHLYQAPLTYYTQDGKWDLPPGFEKGNNTRFSRKIGSECMTCHNMYPEFEELSVNKYHKVPDGIGCERCHGPGELHVKAKKSGNLADSGNIVNPSKLPTHLKNDVCQRCHLQGNAVLKEGKDFFDFKPGMELSSVMTVFRPEYKEENAFIMASHSERMQQSICYKATRNHQSFEALNCITCHNPHKSVQKTESQYFNKTCQSCHEESQNPDRAITVCKASKEHRAKADDNCIDCHMPKSGSVDIPHVAIHDHNIRVPDTTRDENQQAPDINELTVSKLSSYNNDNPSKKTMAKAYLYYYEKFRNKPRFLDSAHHYMTRLPKASLQAEWIHYYFMKQAKNRLITFVKKQDSLRLSKAKPHYQIGQAYFDREQFTSATTHFEKAVNIKPYNLEYRNKLATVYIRRKELKKAQNQLDFIIQENPQLAIAQNNQGFLYMAQKRFDKAKQHLDKAIALNPDYGQAHLNLGKWHLGQNNKVKARKKLQDVVNQYPGVAKEARQILAMLDQRNL